MTNETSFLIETLSILMNFFVAVGTIAMAWYSKKAIEKSKESVEYSEKSIKEMKLTRKESNTAHVVMYFENDGHTLYLIIKNTGLTNARDVMIKTNPELTPEDHCDLSNIINKKISIIPPNYEIKTIFHDTVNIIGDGVDKTNPPKLEYEIIIKYTNIYDEIVEEKYNVDLNYLKSISFIENKTYKVELQKNSKVIVTNLKDLK